ncbi:hypothetical protein NQ314_004059 [Rhamnusium bicolor]|uniref:Uncharacterized protein n=1 Tax=Rhamnusium bicolor TaxID=1586634 RepID=A0AAV8ZN86_9CUCU|nr:hypothetical protein NQ314_004059 [Rhamnusium bicolor]
MSLQSHDSNPCNETKFCQMELSNQDSQISHNSSESHLSIITSEENTKLEVCEESESKLLKFNESEAKIEICAEANTDKNCIQEDTEEIKVMEIDRKDEKTFDEKKI